MIQNYKTNEIKSKLMQDWERDS